MQELANLIEKLALVLSAAAAGLTAWNALRKLTMDHEKDDRAELRADKEMYRQRWLAAERSYDHQKRENEKLEQRIDELEKRLHNEWQAKR